jgi:hypothetical protein
MTLLSGVGPGWAPGIMPPITQAPVGQTAAENPMLAQLLQQANGPVKLVEKIAQKSGNRPDLAKQLLDQLEKKGQPLTGPEQILRKLLQLLLHAIQTGQVPQFLAALGQGGGLGGLMNGLGGGGGGNAGGLGGQLGGGGGGGNLGRNLNGLFGGGNRGGGGGGGRTNFAGMRPWSAADREFLNRSIQSDPVNFRNQVDGWGQGQEGNCASVGVIKAAMDRYDNQVFNSVRQVGDGYNIEMQDGFNLNLSAQEMAMARTASHFNGTDNEAKTYAQLCFGAMAKRAHMTGHDGCRSFAGALAELNDGEYPIDSAKLLGLKDKVVNVDPHTLNGQDSCVGWNGSHCVFIDRDNQGNHTADHYGQGVRFRGTDTNGRRLNQAFTLKPKANINDWKPPQPRNRPQPRNPPQPRQAPRSPKTTTSPPKRAPAPSTRKRAG